MFWLSNNPVDQAVGFPLYLSLPIVLSVVLALGLKRISGWLVWALAFALAVVAYVMIVVSVLGYSPTGLAIGLSFTCVTYFPLTGFSVMAVRLMRYFINMRPG